jgi:intracellular multiplication protein IcmE
VKQQKDANLSPNEKWLRQLEELKRQQEAGLSDRDYQDKVRQLQQLMMGQANDLVAAWVPLPAQQYVQAANKEGEGGAIAAATGEAATAANIGGVAGGPGGGAVATNMEIMKSGSILFAVLDTGINSDEDSPVMATIVEGSLKGTKLLGKFKRTDKRLLLQFSTMNVPGLPTSMGINAVAIDPNTARTAVSGKVDNHYLLRYGALFGASFLSGIGSAVKESMSNTTVSMGGGGVTVAKAPNPINVGKVAISGLGSVGDNFVGVMGQYTNMPPTVEIKAGTGVGLLLMSDLSVPKRAPTSEEILNNSGGQK